MRVEEWNETHANEVATWHYSEVGRETRHFELVGEHEFVQMERTA